MSSNFLFIYVYYIIIISIFALIRFFLLVSIPYSSTLCNIFCLTSSSVGFEFSFEFSLLHSFSSSDLLGEEVPIQNLQKV